VKVTGDRDDVAAQPRRRAAAPACAQESTVIMATELGLSPSWCAWSTHIGSTGSVVSATPVHRCC